MSNLEEFLSSLDYRRYDEVVEVPLLWLIQNAMASCDMFNLSTFEGWQEMFAEKCADTGFGHLVDSILERGFLKEGAIGFSFEDREITEGHHRLCAAILLGLDTVFISRWGSNVKAKAYTNLVCAHSNYDDPYPIHVEV